MPEPEPVLTAVMTVAQQHPWLAVAVVVLVVVLLRAFRPRGPVAHPGEVWFAMVPFEDGSGAKDRPVLVLEVRGRRCTVARMTSQDRSARADHARVPAGIPGLPKASWINLRPVQLRRSVLRRRTGDPGEAFVTWYRDVARTRT